MALAALFRDETRRRVTAAVQDAEQRTGAEIVVSVVRASSHYRHADWLCGAALAFLMLLTLLFAPQEVPLSWWPGLVAGAFGAGALLCAVSGAPRRLIIGRRTMDREVTRAAKAAFVDGGVTTTRERVGVLVYVSAWEGRAVVVPDVGVDVAAMGSAWTAAVAALQDAAARRNVDALVAGVATLGVVLAVPHPRRPDDVNELPDEVAVT